MEPFGDQPNSSQTQPNQVRIIQWGSWRTLSSLFMRCLMNAPNSVTFCELFGLPWYYGVEAKTSRTLIPIDLPHDSTTFARVKEKYEDAYDDKKLVFGKEFAFYVSPQKNYKYIPRGYRHSFLIRHPYKTVTSLNKVMMKQKDPGFNCFLDEDVRFEDIWNLYLYTLEYLDADAIIIDADDLVRDPETVLRGYCQHYGIEYKDTFINWDSRTLNEDMLVYGESWFEELLSSSTVRTDPYVKNLLEDPPDISELSQEMQKSIETNLVFYRKLFEKRSKF